MAATGFICPDGVKITITSCLDKCRRKERCMFLPTLRAVVKSLDRGIKDPTVTELLCGVRETYLKKTTDYAIKPIDQLFAIHGSAVHTINEGHTEGNMLSEEHLPSRQRLDPAGGRCTEDHRQIPAELRNAHRRKTEIKI